MGMFELEQQLRAHFDEASLEHSVLEGSLSDRLMFIKFRDDVDFRALYEMEVILKKIVQRLALSHELGRSLLSISYQVSDPELETHDQVDLVEKLLSTVQDSLESDLWKDFPKTYENFAVRVLKVGNFAGSVAFSHISLEIEKKLGGLLYDYWRGKLRVDLDSPQLMLRVILTPSQVHVYQRLAVSARKILGQKNPKNRPYSNPSILDSFLLRAMINMAQIRSGDVLLDPFCGTGSTFIESVDLKVLSLGIELSRLVSWGALQNIQGMQLPAHLILSDARLMPLATNSLDAVVFDPPYGRGASTLGIPLANLLHQVLQQCERVLKPKRFLVMSLIDEVSLEDFFPKKSHLQLLRTFKWYVHRSMTRMIYVFTNDK